MLIALAQRLGRRILQRGRASIATLFYKYGNLKLRRHQYALAAEHYGRAVHLQPDYVNAIYNHGLALQYLKRHGEAVAAFDRVIQLVPDDAEALNNRGNALRDLQQPEAALASYARALSCNPDYLDALHNHGLALLDLHRAEDAVRSLSRLHSLAPNYEFVKGKLLHAKMLCCDWTQFMPLSKSIERDIQDRKHSAEPFGYQGISYSARAMHTCAEIFASRYYPRARIQLWKGKRHNHTKIRIGYVSGEFRNQATSILMTELFELHDKSRFSIFAFDNGWDDGSEIRRRLTKAFDEVVDISRIGDYEAAGMIRDRNIDILVNLNGYFGLERQGVFSHKPSPIQVNYLGFPGTLGADYMDYILADRIVIPPGHERYYTEKVVWLPDCYQVNDSSRMIADHRPTREEANLPESGFVFCCFNNNYKITPEVFDIWMRLLIKTPQSVIWLIEDNAAASRNLQREAQRRGVAPERLVFAERVELPTHLARHQLAGLFLDTFPSNAHTTASDALWAGLPLLTCMGTTFSGRVAASLLNAVGLPDLVTQNTDEYEALAFKLATTPRMLSDIRVRLRQNKSTTALFDADRFRRHIEAAYAMMWEKHLNGDVPAAFSVPSTE